MQLRLQLIPVRTEHSVNLFLLVTMWCMIKSSHSKFLCPLYYLAVFEVRYKLTPGSAKRKKETIQFEFSAHAESFHQSPRCIDKDILYLSEIYNTPESLSSYLVLMSTAYNCPKYLTKIWTHGQGYGFETLWWDFESEVVFFKDSQNIILTFSIGSESILAPRLRFLLL